MSSVIGRWTNHYGIIIRELLFANSDTGDLLMENKRIFAIIDDSIYKCCYYILCIM